MVVVAAVGLAGVDPHWRAAVNRKRIDPPAAIEIKSPSVSRPVGCLEMFSAPIDDLPKPGLDRHGLQRRLTHARLASRRRLALECDVLEDSGFRNRRIV